MHEATRYILRFFRYDHLPEGNAKQNAKMLCGVADILANTLPDDPETTVAIRKLLEAKDAAVRASLEIKVF
jgi:hypothetical protein